MTLHKGKRFFLPWNAQNDQGKSCLRTSHSTLFPTRLVNSTSGRFRNCESRLTVDYSMFPLSEIVRLERMNRAKVNNIPRQVVGCCCCCHCFGRLLLMDNDFHAAFCKPQSRPRKARPRHGTACSLGTVHFASYSLAFKTRGRSNLKYYSCPRGRESCAGHRKDAPGSEISFGVGSSIASQPVTVRFFTLSPPAPRVEPVVSTSRTTSPSIPALRFKNIEHWIGTLAARRVSSTQGFFHVRFFLTVKRVVDGRLQEKNLLGIQLVHVPNQIEPV